LAAESADAKAKALPAKLIKQIPRVSGTFAIILLRVGRTVAVLLSDKMEESPGSIGQGAR